MSFDLKTILKGKANTKPRILLYAQPKVGKTTFGSKFPNHLIVNIDGSSERIDCCRTPRIKSVTEFIDILTSLYKEQHSYTTLVIDTVDWLEKLICDEVANIHDKKTVEDIGYGRGYPLVVQRWREILEALEQVRLKRNMTILMLAHADVRKHAPPMSDEFDIYVPKLYGKKEKADTSLSLILEFSDIIGFAQYKVLTKEVGEGFKKHTQAVGQTAPILYLSSNNPNFIAGNRFNLKPEIEFSYNAFIKAFQEKPLTKPEEKKENV